MSVSMINSTNNAIAMFNLYGAKNATITNSNSVNNISDDFSQSDETSVFKSIVGKYDITNISRNDANAMYKELYNNGLISLKDMLHATFDPTHIPGWQDGVSTINGVKISSDPNKKSNLLEDLKKMDAWSNKYGNSEFQNNYDMALQLAEKIHYFQS